MNVQRSALTPAVLLCCLVAVGLVGAQDTAEREPGWIRGALDSIRDDLIGLEFEKALASIDALLGDPYMTDSERGELIVLRAEAHVAFGDLDAAEEDYRLILRMRPSYVPEQSLTPKKAMVRFEKVRASLVGSLKLVLDPVDAVPVIEGRPLQPDADGAVPLLEGEYDLAVERTGYDAYNQRVEIAANKDTLLEVHLIPNSRTIVLRTEPDEVEVLIDGVSVGFTERKNWSTLSAEPPAELTIENVSLGEHRFELRKECYRTERLTDNLTVDLLDRSPKRYRPVELKESKARMTLDGGPEGAEVVVDGRGLARLPAAGVAVCAGERKVELKLADRILFQSTERFAEGAETVVAVKPRPNVVLVGVDEWPREWRRWAAEMNDLGRVGAGRQTDLSHAEEWSGVELGENIDLVLAVVPERRDGAGDRWYLYSPVLRQVERIDVPFDGSSRPTWTTPYWGFATTDTQTGGRLRVVRVDPGGPAAQAGLVVGDRILSVDGQAFEESSELRQALSSATAPSVRLQWRDLPGEPREAEMTATSSPRLDPDPGARAQAMLRAAWAVTDAAGDPDRAPLALANLALLFDAFDEPGLAVETWRRVRLGDRNGVGEGTRQYYMGRALERLGREEEALIAYRLAAKSGATAFEDGGPLVAPAAADRLADLGVVDLETDDDR